VRAAVLTAAIVAALAAGAAPALAGEPLTANTSVSTRFLYFGDTVTARVVVLVDRRAADPESVRLSSDFGEWDQVAPTRTTSVSAGPYTRRSWSFDIVCVQPACLPQGRPLVARLPPLTLSARRADGSTVTVRRAWPALSIAGRYGAAAPGSTPTFGANRNVPPATFRVDPMALKDGLYAGALLLTVLVLGLVGFELSRHRSRRPHGQPSPLAHALARVRQARTRPVDDRRRAVGLLARSLPADRDSAVSAAASRIAWSRNEPAPDRLDEIVRMVESNEGES
jgi:hypothetical protein